MAHGHKGTIDYFSGLSMDIILTSTEYPDPQNVFRLKFCLDFPEIFKLEL